MMKPKESIWQKLGLHEWFLKQEAVEQSESIFVLTPDNVYKYIVEKFHESIGQLSFANRIVFYHEFIVCFNPDDFKEFMDNKKGIFGLIIQESIKEFYTVLKKLRLEGKTVEPSSSKWVFRFVSHPEYRRGDKSLIGKLLPGSSQQKQENLRITFIPRQTGLGETVDVNEDILKSFTFYSDGYYEVPYREDLVIDKEYESQNSARPIARLEAIIPDKEYAGKKIEFLMVAPDLTVTGKDDPSNSFNLFKIPSEWVNCPHLRIRFNEDNNKFYLASFGEKTILNEKEVNQSEVDHCSWTELPFNSKIVLNGIVGINLFKG